MLQVAVRAGRGEEFRGLDIQTGSFAWKVWLSAACAGVVADVNSLNGFSGTVIVFPEGVADRGAGAVLLAGRSGP